MKEKIIEAALFIAIGTVFYSTFIFVFANFFDKRMPFPSEFTPLFAVFLAGCAVLLRKRDTS